MNPYLVNAHLADLGNRLVAHGPSAVESELNELARIARQRGLAHTERAVMIDRSASRVVRERAFAAVSSALVKARRAGSPALARAS
jgi:hypothetical protein